MKWHELIKKIAYFANALKSTTVAIGEANLNVTGAIPDANFVSPRELPTAIKDAAIDGVMDCATKIIQADKHPQRGRYYDFAGALLDGDETPDSVGPFGEVRLVAAPKTVLSAGTKQEVLIYLRNTTRYSVNPMLYYLEGQRLHHTAASAVEIETAILTRPTLADVNSDGQINLPENMLNYATAKALSLLPLKEGYNTAMAQAFNVYASTYEQFILGGERGVPPQFPAYPGG